jgi:hypothetical protein
MLKDGFNDRDSIYVHVCWIGARLVLKRKRGL